MIALTSIEDHVSSRRAMVADLLARSAKYQDEEVRQQQELRLARVLGILESMEVVFQGIRKNSNLSDAGKLEQFRQLAKEILGSLAWFFKDTVTADEAYVRAHGAILAVPAMPQGRSELADLLRAQEVRAWMRTLPRASVAFLFIKAVQNGDAEMIRAIRTAPGAALLDDNLIERIVKENTEEERLTRLASLDVLRNELRDLSSMLKSWLEGYKEITIVTPAITPAPNAMVTR
ncbi:MAG: hypothetical protein E8D46_10145 [Nitrospira sp.]|nr:MAG: hypothetical protein E8D46_10145 [Nitrospira sp.]